MRVFVVEPGLNHNLRRAFPGKLVYQPIVTVDFPSVLLEFIFEIRREIRRGHV